MASTKREESAQLFLINFPLNCASLESSSWLHSILAFIAASNKQGVGVITCCAASVRAGQYFRRRIFKRRSFNSEGGNISIV